MSGERIIVLAMHKILNIGVHMKISQMIIEFAGDYINLGDTVEEMQNYLNVSCIAWNISLLPKNERKAAVDLFINNYMKTNPNDSNFYNVQQDIELLIKNKCKYFPNEKYPIESAQVKECEDEYKITVFSYKKKNDLASKQNELFH